MKEQISKEQILKMSRDELIDFLFENWPEMTLTLPTGREKEYYNTHPTDRLREIALSLID